MSKLLPSILLLFIAGLFLPSCSTTSVYYTGSSQTGVFYNQLAMKTGGGGLGGFSAGKRRYRRGRQIVGNDVLHTIGLSFLPGVNGNSNTGSGEPTYYPTIGIHYHPRINLGQWSANGAFSMDFPMHMGVSIGTDFVRGRPDVAQLKPEETAGFTAEIPMTFNFNFGQAATKESTAPFGGFLGAGYSFAVLMSGRTGTYVSPTETRYNLPIGHGPHFRGGFRFRTGTISWQLYGSFMYNVYAPSHLAGAGLGITFGRW